MRLIELKCPSCGALLQVDMNAQQAWCSHCGHQLIVDDERVRADGESFREAGYQFEQGRILARQEQAEREFAEQQAREAEIARQAQLALNESRRQARITRSFRWITAILTGFFILDGIQLRLMSDFAVIAGAALIAVFLLVCKRFSGTFRIALCAMLAFLVLYRLIT